MMMIPLEMLDLARRLFTYEAMAGESFEPVESTTLRVYEKLRKSLVQFAGVASFQSLASRALALARSEDPCLSVAQVTSEGFLQGLGEFEPQIDIVNHQAGVNQLGEGGVILIARLLGLLHIFLGESLMLRLLRDAWPGTALDDRNSGNGRKA